MKNLYKIVLAFVVTLNVGLAQAVPEDVQLLKGPDGETLELWSAPLDQFVFLDSASRTIKIGTGETIAYDTFTNEALCATDEVCQRVSGKVAPIIIIAFGAGFGAVSGYDSAGWRGAIVGGIFGTVGGIYGAAGSLARGAYGVYYSFMSGAAGLGGGVLVQRIR
jgi:hypothetical protein